MTMTKMLHIRVDKKIKEEAAAILNNQGLTVSEAVRLFLETVEKTQTLPLTLDVPKK